MAMLPRTCACASDPRPLMTIGITTASSIPLLKTRIWTFFTLLTSLRRIPLASCELHSAICLEHCTCICTSSFDRTFHDSRLITKELYFRVLMQASLYHSMPQYQEHSEDDTTHHVARLTCPSRRNISICVWSCYIFLVRCCSRTFIFE